MPQFTEKNLTIKITDMNERELLAFSLRGLSKTFKVLCVIIDVLLFAGYVGSTMYAYDKESGEGASVVMLIGLIIFITIITAQAILIKMAKGIAELLCPASESKDEQKELRVKVNVDEPANIADTLASV